MPLLLTLTVVLTGSYEEISIDDAKAAALAMFPPEEESKQGAEESAAAGMQRRGSGGWERVEEMDLGAWEVTSHMRVLLWVRVESLPRLKDFKMEDFERQLGHV